MVRPLAPSWLLRLELLNSIAWIAGGWRPTVNVFFKGADGSMIEAYWNDVEHWQWNNHHQLPNSKMASAPCTTAWIWVTQDGVFTPDWP